MLITTSGPLRFRSCGPRRCCLRNSPGIAGRASPVISMTLPGVRLTRRQRRLPTLGSRCRSDGCKNADHDWRDPFEGPEATVAASHAVIDHFTSERGTAFSSGSNRRNCSDTQLSFSPSEACQRKTTPRTEGASSKTEVRHTKCWKQPRALPWLS